LHSAVNCESDQMSGCISQERLVLGIKEKEKRCQDLTEESAMDPYAQWGGPSAVSEPLRAPACEPSTRQVLNSAGPEKGVRTHLDRLTVKQ
jgi:hypothetical protein